MVTGQFVFEGVKKEAVGSALYEEHLKLVTKNRLAKFAGFWMPLWYSSISEEHKAVRKRVGLFDCSHMGVLEVSGRNAEGFLNSVTTNNVAKLKVGSAQYSYVVDAAGFVLDDIIIYKRGDEKFMVVVNAANEGKIKAYLRALEEGKACVKADEPERKLEYRPAIRDMRDVLGGEDCRVDIALQGPASLDIVLSIVEDDGVLGQLKELKPFKFVETVVDGYDCIISRTGYTGASVGFEFYVHPQKAGQLWGKLLAKGKSFGLLPCGLGARDSLRIEAGLPLYGHELAGAFNISPFEVGYGWAVKMDKGFFIGKNALEKRAEAAEMKVVRLGLAGEKGVRPVRQNDGVLNSHGECVGWVLSSATIEEKQISLAFVGKDGIEEGDAIGLYYIARNAGQAARGRKGMVEKGERLEADIVGKILSRFERF